MQNRYAGDIHDFAKFLLLSQLKGKRVGIVWCLFPDEKNGDGKYRQFENYPFLKVGGIGTEKLIKLLKRFNCLIKCTKEKPSLSKLWPLIKKYLEEQEVEATFPSESNGKIDWDSLYIEKPEFKSKRKIRKEYRKKYIEHHFRFFKGKGCRVIFFDPDNNLRIEEGKGTNNKSIQNQQLEGDAKSSTIKKSTKKGGKYLFLDEVIPFLKEKMEVIVYNSFPRKKREQFIRERSKEILFKLQKWNIDIDFYAIRFAGKIQDHFYWVFFPLSFAKNNWLKTLPSLFQVYKIKENGTIVKLQ